MVMQKRYEEGKERGQKEKDPWLLASYVAEIHLP
jgi:hypothetical protein